MTIDIRKQYDAEGNVTLHEAPIHVGRTVMWTGLDKITRTGVVTAQSAKNIMSIKCDTDNHAWRVPVKYLKPIIK